MRRAVKRESVLAAQKYRTRFTADGITVQPRGADFEVGLRLERWGYGEALETVPAAEPTSDGQRVTYVRGGLTEWYINRPKGFEQGFTVATRPRRTDDKAGSLRLEMSVSGATGRGRAFRHRLFKIGFSRRNARDPPIVLNWHQELLERVPIP